MKLPFATKTKHDHRVNKTFNYDRNGVTLGFTLRIDKKDELKIFEGLLAEALEDVREEINKE